MFGWSIADSGAELSIRDLQTTAREAILSIKKRQYIYDKFVDLLEC